MNRTQEALELRKAIQIFLESLDPDTQTEKMLEVPTVFPVYQTGRAYKTRDIFRWGKNSVGDPQLWQVLQDHTSAEEWTPDTAVSLYKAIGMTEDGHPEWVQPLGATDAYAKWDVVSHKDKLWQSDVDANVWEPGVYGWSEVMA